MRELNSILIIYNPNAMKGKIDEFLPKIKQRLSLRFPVVDVVSTPNSDGAEGLALNLHQNMMLLFLVVEMERSIRL